MAKEDQIADVSRLRGYNWDRFTGSNKVSLSPCFVGCVLITSDGQGNTDVTLYDGESAQDPQIFKIRGTTNATKRLYFRPVLKTNRGLYVEFGSNVEEVLVEYERLEE